jgi:hypothetical protein
MALQNWKALFLESLRQSPNVSRACRVGDVSRVHAYETRAADPEFAAAWDEILAGSVDDVEEAAFVRARTESDTLAIFLLKCHRPEVYARPQQVQVGAMPTPHAIPDVDPREAQADQHAAMASDPRPDAPP